jgi:hypothetical protein
MNFNVIIIIIAAKQRLRYIGQLWLANSSSHLPLGKCAHGHGSPEQK